MFNIVQPRATLNQLGIGRIGCARFPSVSNPSCARRLQASIGNWCHNILRPTSAPLNSKVVSSTMTGPWHTIRRGNESQQNLPVSACDSLSFFLRTLQLATLLFFYAGALTKIVIQLPFHQLHFGILTSTVLISCRLPEQLRFNLSKF